MKYLQRILVLAILAAPTATAQSQKISPDVYRDGPKIRQVFRSIVAKPSEATVRVLANGKEVAFGVIVDPDGWILTKWSEIDAKRDKVSVKLKDGTLYSAKVVGVKDNPDSKGTSFDLAMLKIDAKGLPTIEWRNSKEAKVGRWVASVGIGADPVAIGVISVATRKHALGDQPPKFSNANSGYLGVGLEPGMGGAKVSAVSAKSPAEKAGLKVNDLIYEADRRKITDPDTLILTVGRLKPGDEVFLKIKRGEEELEITATLAKRPKELQGNPQETMGTKLSTRRGGFPFILQHDSGVRPEDCGGPLVDLDGKTVGINIARAGRTETYAIPSEEIQPLLADLKSGKLAPNNDPIAKVEPAPKTSQFVLRKESSFTDKEKVDKNRPKMSTKRYMKVEEVKLVAGVIYTFEMITSDAKLDPYLILEDPQGKTVAEDDDSGGFPNAKIVFRAPSDGVYRIIATTFNPSETGNFTLTVRAGKDKSKK